MRRTLVCLQPTGGYVKSLDAELIPRKDKRYDYVRLPCSLIENFLVTSSFSLEYVREL